MKIFIYLLLLFTVVPAVELILLIRVSGVVGGLRTFAVIIITGIIGAHLARQQGFKAMEKISRELSQGRIPAVEVVDGVIVLIAGIVLLTPGFLTDLAGFLLLIPFSRKLVRAWAFIKFKQFIKSGISGHSGYTTETNFRKQEDVNSASANDGNAEIIDVEAREVKVEMELPRDSSKAD